MTVYLIAKGCPICSSDVRGNDSQRFYCKICNLLFNTHHIEEEKRLHAQVMVGVPKEDSEPARLKKKTEQATERDIVTAKAIPEEIEPLDAPEEEQPTEEKDPEPTIEDKGLESPDKIVASDSSTKMHSGDCHFVKKIRPENRIFLSSLQEGLDKDYLLCVCLRRKKAKGEL